jgi:hypothetical protein
MSIFEKFVRADGSEKLQRVVYPISLGIFLEVLKDVRINNAVAWREDFPT